MALERISLVGGGNMAEALALGWIRSKLVRPEQLYVVEPLPQRRAVFETLGIPVADGVSGWPGADVLVWAVKPQVFKEAAVSWAGQLGSTTVLSIMAGVSIQTIRAACAPSAIVRTMPNTPALVGAGVTGLFAEDRTKPDVLRQIRQLLETIGIVYDVSDEQMLHAVTALTGSGPGFLMAVAEGLERAAQQMGIAPGDARRLIGALLEGSGRWASVTGEPFEVLRQRVTSPGGATAAGLKIVDERALRDIIVETVHAAERRSHEMEKGSK